MSCCVYMGAEQRLVSFGVEPGDTARSVAAEMVETLGLGRDEETRSSVLRQVAAAMSEPAGDGSAAAPPPAPPPASDEDVAVYMPDHDLVSLA